ncbi:uncharacterized protein [Haliotis asinina]|uniref:uncharacterized protein n=1 Tax=Haliotis asinina TaxID=109174 RepID=UPI003531E516
MAADPRKTDESNKRRPSSAPKTSDMTNIPKIVLEDKDRGDPDVCVVSPYQTDMGLPAASMPNLALDRFGENNSDGGSDSKLGVFCSPRMTRRSVDLDVSNRDPNKKDMEWLEAFDQSNSLRVLSSSSRVGSAISLNSECTARSIGLISNDSSSDSTSMSERFVEPTGEKAAQLRRLMSYPEDRTSVDSGVTRASQSCANLKAAQKESLDRGDITEAKLCLLPSESTETYSLDDDELPNDKSFEEVYDEAYRQHIVCYKRGPKSFRDGRIRQWLQDMDKTPQKEVSE